MTLYFMISLYLLIFGLFIGSFLNALIYRLPREIPFGLSRSFCPHCKETIAWYFNLPLVSYLYLKGRCFYCQKKISLKYPLVEGVTMLFTYLILPVEYSSHSMLLFSFHFLVGCCFIVHFFVDLEHQILPNSINLVLGIVFFIYGILHHQWFFWLGGFAIGLCFPLFVTWIFYLIRGQVGLGLGDIKLFAAMGFFLGPFGIILNIYLSCLLGAIVGLIFIGLKKMGKNHPFPFGPAIIIVASIQIFMPIYFIKIVDYFGLPY